MEDLLKSIQDGILDGDMKKTVDGINTALDAGSTAEMILKNGMIPAMTEVGHLFERGEYFVPELLVAARAMQGGINILKPFLQKEDVKPIGKVVIGTVQGDLHDIGKNLVSILMAGVGLEVFDLGVDVAPGLFVEKVKETSASIVAISALLTTTMIKIPTIIQAFDEAGLRDEVNIMVGGAPITETFAKSVHADGYAPDANQAAKLALQLL